MGIFRKTTPPIGGTSPPAPPAPPATPPITANPSLAIYANASLARARALLGGTGPRSDNIATRNLPAPSLTKPSLLGGG